MSKVWTRFVRRVVYEIFAEEKLGRATTEACVTRAEGKRVVEAGGTRGSGKEHSNSKNRISRDTVLARDIRDKSRDPSLFLKITNSLFLLPLSSSLPYVRSKRTNVMRYTLKIERTL